MPPGAIVINANWLDKAADLGQVLGLHTDPRAGFGRDHFQSRGFVLFRQRVLRPCSDYQAIDG